MSQNQQKIKIFLQTWKMLCLEESSRNAPASRSRHESTAPIFDFNSSSRAISTGIWCPRSMAASRSLTWGRCSAFYMAADRNGKQIILQHRLVLPLTCKICTLKLIKKISIINRWTKFQKILLQKIHYLMSETVDLKKKPSSLTRNLSTFNVQSAAFFKTSRSPSTFGRQTRTDDDSSTISSRTVTGDGVLKTMTETSRSPSGKINRLKREK